MAGRAGLGLAQGFMQGFDFMDRIDKRERRLGLQEAAGKRAEQSHQWQGEQVGRQKEDWQREDDARLVQAMNEGVQTGRIDPRIASEFGKRFDIDWTNYVNPEFGQSLEVLDRTARGEGSLKDPEFNKAFETVFRTEINKGTGEEYEGADGAHRLEQKRLAGVYPGPDGKSLMVDLEVLDRGPGGEQWRRAPVTANRSAKDDEVKAIPLEAALQKLRGHQLMYQAVQGNPELQSVIKQYAARTGAKLPEAKERYGAPVQHPELGWVQPGPDGQLRQLKSQGGERHGDPFEHPQLGWVQPGPDGKLTQLKSGDAGGEGEWRRLSNGTLFNRRTGETRDVSGGGGGALGSPQLSQIQQSSRYFHGTFNPDGSFLGIPAGAREKYTLAMQRAQELVQNNVPLFEAINLANLSTLDGLDESGARKIAEQEATERFAGWTQGGERDAYIESRVPELIQESKSAEQRYSQIVKGGDAKPGGGQGRGTPAPAQPQQPADLEMAGATTEALPQDGSAVQLEDGSYAGRVNRDPASTKPQPAATPPAESAPAQPRQAPPKAIEHLRKNPQLANDFRAKYGYLPEGF